ncbi:MAG: hypothetical protein ACMXYL_04695 [Candidatus Woesearchaeota archaeon]
MKRVVKYNFLVAFIFFIIVFGIVMLVSFNKSQDDTLYDDTFQRTIVHLISYEYHNMEGFVPQDFVRINDEPQLSDFECDIILYDMRIEREHDNTCIMPLWWGDYSYKTNASSIKISYRIFSEENTQEYKDYLINTLEDMIMLEYIEGGRVESRTTIVPTQPGPAIDNLVLYNMVIRGDEDKHVLISIIISGDTIYIIIEESNNQIGHRRFTNSFWPEYHDTMISSYNITII